MNFGNPSATSSSEISFSIVIWYDIVLIIAHSPPFSNFPFGAGGELVLKMRRRSFAFGTINPYKEPVVSVFTTTPRKGSAGFNSNSFLIASLQADIPHIYLSVPVIESTNRNALTPSLSTICSFPAFFANSSPL